jgi:hypothetical protein
MPNKTEQIRALNDDLRKHLIGGLAVITPGVASLGQAAVERLVKTIAVFDDFCHENDPHEEHDFGSFNAEGETIFFKIDYYDKSLSMHSPDPADPTLTQRVITVMLASEY